MAIKPPWGKTSAANVGDLSIDTSTCTISVKDGSSWKAIDNSIGLGTPSFAIHEGTVQIGNLKMDVEQFESCLRHLMELTKEAKPEDFI